MPAGGYQQYYGTNGGFNPQAPGNASTGMGIGSSNGVFNPSTGAGIASSAGGGGINSQGAALQAALSQGLQGQDAVNWVQQNYPQYNQYGSGIEWQPSSGTFGVPGGYFAQNPQSGSWGMVDSRGGGGMGGGGDVGAAGFSPGNVAYQNGPQFAQQSATNFGSAPTLSLGSINQPGAVNPQQVQAGSVNAQQVQAPGALNAQMLNQPGGFQNLSADQMAQTPGYQFALQQATGAMENSAAAQGMLHSPNTVQGIGQLATNLASQTYQQQNQNALQAYQTNFNNAYATTGANNAAAAQAYGLTNQYGMQAQLANQGANLQAGQFNAGQSLAAQEANQAAGMQAGQFNAGMNFNTQQQNIANQLAGYNANVQAQLGYGSLNNQAQGLANQYNLGMANNSLGFYQANQGYNLGLGNLELGLGGLGLGYANYGLNANAQNFGQQYSLANMGLQAGEAQGGFGSQYGANAGNTLTGIGNAYGAGTVGSANAWNQGIGNAYNSGLGAYGAYLYGQNGGG